LIPGNGKRKTTDTDEDVVMVTQEQVEDQKRTKRLLQLTMAREKRKQERLEDKQAESLGLPKPSAIRKFRKNHHLLVDDTGNIQHGFHPTEWLRNQYVSLPLVEALALNPDYNREFKEALGYGGSKSHIVNNVTSTLDNAGTVEDDNFGLQPTPEVVTAPLVVSGNCCAGKYIYKITINKDNKS
jgi:hypothetical protein